MKFRKKPVVIDAVQFWNGDGANTIEECVEFCDGFAIFDSTAPYFDTRLQIKTLEGTMYANDGDWIIKGVQGEFYPCKPDIFEQTYEKVED